jgi:two-component system chemotaxis sensor kinase CheA
MKARLVPMGQVFRRYARTVRDLAAAHGRLVRLAIEGADVEVDTSVIEHIRDPLTHMIRNAIDHGIEVPEARRRNGKDPAGTLILRAVRDSGSIVVELTDDGAGIDPARILARARAQGRLSVETVPTRDEILRLVFEPGFSTADRVSDLSGRGVGLDVVRRNVEALRGSASIESTPGRGTTVSLRLPLTLAIIPGLEVEAAGETYVVPLDSVVECLDVPRPGPRADRLSTLELRGSSLPCVRLRRLFGAGPGAEREQAVVARVGGRLAGLIVDRVAGESQTVIKPLGSLFRATRWFSGATILGDGRVAPILDLAPLVRQAAQSSGAGAELPHSR